MKTEIRTDLLRQLADHLLHGKLGHEKFDFSTYNTIAHTLVPGFNGNLCGTAGCALGEAPILWPDKWEFNPIGSITLIEFGNSISTSFAAMNFFRIDYSQYYHLFVPRAQKKKWGDLLIDAATKEEVANNIIKFCDLAERGELS